MKRDRQIKYTAIALLAAFGISYPAQAIIIRHDVPDTRYLRLGNAFPSVGRLLINNSFACSGTLIYRRWVLTAAHCLDDNFRFATFAVGRTSYFSNRAFMHPGWLRSGRDLGVGLDIALLRLNRPVIGVRPALLFPRRVPVVRRAGVYVGFGDTGTGYLPTVGLNRKDGKKRGAVNIIDAYGSFYGDSNRLIFSDFDNKYDWNNRLGSLQHPLEGAPGPGDSGGAVFVNRRLAGIISFVQVGSDYSFDRPDSGYGDLIASVRVGPFFPWIGATIRRNTITASSLSLSKDITTNRSNTNSTTQTVLAEETVKSIPESSQVTGLLAIAGLLGLTRLFPGKTRSIN
jgi:Trypsin